MGRYRLTPRARDDLKAIGRYTERVWGRAQRNRYLHELVGRLAWLAENPNLGRDRPELGEGYHSFAQGRHLIFYLLDPPDIHIIGILHQEMDPIRHLGDG